MEKFARKASEAVVWVLILATKSPIFTWFQRCLQWFVLILSSSRIYCALTFELLFTHIWTLIEP